MLQKQLTRRIYPAGFWWEKQDSNLRSAFAQQIYSLPPLSGLGYSPIYGGGSRTRTHTRLAPPHGFQDRSLTI